MERIPLATSCSSVSLEAFWNAIQLYHDRPNLINKKIVAASPLLLCQISPTNANIRNLYQIFTWESLIYEIRKLSSFGEITPAFIKSVTETHDKGAEITVADFDSLKKSYEGIFISIRVLYSRSSSKNCIEIVIFDKLNKLVTFHAIQELNQPIIAPRFQYHFELTKTNNLRILLNNFQDAETSSGEWLVDKLFPKILKWSEEGLFETGVKSLSFIPVDEYCLLYSELKQKYGEGLVKDWPTKATTDPQKYIFEDIAIASYLICLWRKLEAQDVNFVDCGCGNGLLVYVLNKEGYRGHGLDLRRRQIWDLFSEAELHVGAVTPESRFPDATWIIGNHSDELTPWIPVIALNSSPHTNYFALPCCSYDFSGRKYIRLNTKVSQYEDYLHYIESISKLCGFQTSVDKLRIPSTRRTCLIGVREGANDLEGIKVEVGSFVEMRIGGGFIQRVATESVRNCTKLDRNLIRKIVTLIVEELLHDEDFLLKKNGDKWNQGGTRSIRDLSLKISLEDKKTLKNEGGGLKTLLKNHRYIFAVGRGTVSLQKPLSLQQCHDYKDKACWFLENHPNGCFFEAESCAYKHVL